MATGCDVLARQPIDSGKTLVPMLMAGADWSAGVRCYGAELEAGGLQPRRPPVVLCLYPFHALVQAQQREWQAFLDWLYREQLVEELPSAHFVNCPITGGRVASGSVPVHSSGSGSGSGRPSVLQNLRYVTVASRVRSPSPAPRPVRSGAARLVAVRSARASLSRSVYAMRVWRGVLVFVSRLAGLSRVARPVAAAASARPALLQRHVTVVTSAPRSATVLSAQRAGAPRRGGRRRVRACGARRCVRAASRRPV